MKSLFAGNVILIFFIISLTSCTSVFVKDTSSLPEEKISVQETPISIISDFEDTTYVESIYSEEEAILAQMLQFQNDALNALEEGDFSIAETMIDSASVLSTQVVLDNISDESLVIQYRNTLASLFQEYGRILYEVDRINREDPMAWLEELSASDPEEFKNGIWTDDELKTIIKKIALRCDVPIDYNDHVKKSIHFFQTQRRDEMEKWMRRSGRYLPLIQEILDKEGLPLDIAYLSMIESGFSAKAYSRARASGLWQFIYSTGRLYGLNRTSWIDERRDPIKSTKAAVQHLKDLHKMYGDWRLVMAAYNCGPTRITRQYRAGNDDFWSMTLPPETRNYVPSFMAAVIISKAPDLFGFEGIEFEPPMEFDVVEVHPYTSLAKAAKCAGVNVQEIKDLNTELLGNNTPAGKEKYSLKIPKGTGEIFISEYEKLPVEKYIPPKITTYYVKRNDTLSGISQKVGVSVSKLMAANNIRNPRRLRIGLKLQIPGATTQVASLSTSSRTSSIKTTIPVSKENTFTYTVKKNDSLWLIARRNGTTVSMLQALNEMGRNTKIVPGEKIIIPQSKNINTSSRSAESTSVSKNTGQITYIIQRNDTLYEIAQKYGVSYKDIMKLNKIKDHRKIKPGQKIIIKPKE
ncbi:LysM peptidoglycan-binding domain-containing protein [Candidatus Latescibacterota bacterium]